MCSKLGEDHFVVGKVIKEPIRRFVTSAIVRRVAVKLYFSAASTSPTPNIPEALDSELGCTPWQGPYDVGNWEYHSDKWDFEGSIQDALDRNEWWK